MNNSIETCDSMPQVSEDSPARGVAAATLVLPSATVQAIADSAEVPPTGRIRPLDPDSSDDIVAAARLHARLHGQGWRARLAERLLRHVYSGPLVRDGLLRAVLFCTGRRSAGMVAFTARPRAFRRGFFRRHLFHSLAILALLTLVAPGALSVLPAGRRARLERGETETVDAAGEIIALSADWSTEAQPHSGMAIREHLFHHALDHLRSAGIAEVATELPDSRQLAEAAAGVVARRERVEGSSQNAPYWMLKLNTAQHETERGVPESWSVRAPSGPILSVPAGWKAAWEHQFGLHPVHRFEADDTVARLKGLVTLSPDMRILDFGCGYGLVAERLARCVGEMWVWDEARNVRRLAREQLAGSPNVRFLDPRAFEGGAAPRFDLILINSVVQYMTEEEFHGWLPRWRALLAPGGELILSDLIPVSHRVRYDLFEVLRFAWRHGMLLSELGHSLRSVATYWRNPHGQRLMKVDEARLRREAAAAGFEVEFASHNLTVRSRRWGVILRPVAEGFRAGNG